MPDRRRCARRSAWSVHKLVRENDIAGLVPGLLLVCFMADRPFVVSAIGAANLKNLEPPSTVKAVLIAGDRGRGADGRKAGEDYAEMRRSPTKREASASP